MSNDLILLPPNNDVEAIAGIYDQIVDMALASIAHSSGRIYNLTYRAWYDWCLTNRRDPFNLIAGNVLDFLKSQPVCASTRERHLYALRKLAKTIYTVAAEHAKDRYRIAYETLLPIRAPEAGAREPLARSKRVLDPDEANLALRAWADINLISIRNRALIAVLLLAGLRRSEAAALRWADVDFKNGLLIVQQGKDKQRRIAALIGDFGLEALQEWREAQGGNCQYVFCGVRKGDILGPDKPLAVQAVYQIVQQTAKLVGGEDFHFSPHDSRRTLIIEALINGASVLDVKDQVGHRWTELTEKYARSATAVERRQRLRLRYGD